jgi:hypothetical protein
MTHVALIADDTSDRLTLYKNGQLVAYLDVAVSLNGINDEVAYLGRSLFADDPRFQGEITEFRIYSEVLSDEAIAKSNDLGPDAVFTMTN